MHWDTWDLHKQKLFLHTTMLRERCQIHKFILYNNIYTMFFKSQNFRYEETKYLFIGASDGIRGGGER